MPDTLPDLPTILTNLDKARADLAAKKKVLDAAIAANSAASQDYNESISAFRTIYQQMQDALRADVGDAFPSSNVITR